MGIDLILIVRFRGLSVAAIRPNGARFE